MTFFTRIGQYLKTQVKEKKEPMALRDRKFSFEYYNHPNPEKATGIVKEYIVQGTGHVYCIEYEGHLFPFNHSRLPRPYQEYNKNSGYIQSLSRRVSDTTYHLMLMYILERGFELMRRAIANQGKTLDTTVQQYAERYIMGSYPQVYQDAINRGLIAPRGVIPTDPIAGFKGATTEPFYTTTTEPTPKKQGEPTMSDEQTVKILKDLKTSIDSLKRPSLLEEQLITAVVEKTKEIATAELQLELQGKLDAFINDKYGILPKQVEVVVNKDHSATLTGLFHEKFNDILTMIANSIPVMLTGAAGTGKNFTLEQVADALDIPFYYTGAITQEYKLTGFIDAGGRYHETEFYKAFTGGGLFMLDEVDASSPETLVILNGAIANRYFDFPIGRAKAHPNFRIACAGNTFGTGADMVYVGRNVLDGATLDRFCVIKMDYDLEVEAKLCPDKDLFGFIQVLRKTVDKMKLRHIVGMRASINGYKALEAGMSKQFIIESIILKGLGVDDLSVLKKNLVGSMPSEWFRSFNAYVDSVVGAR